MPALCACGCACKSNEAYRTEPSASSGPNRSLFVCSGCIALALYLPGEEPELVSGPAGDCDSTCELSLVRSFESTLFAHASTMEAGLCRFTFFACGSSCFEIWLLEEAALAVDVDLLPSILLDKERMKSEEKAAGVFISDFTLSTPMFM